MNLRAGPTGSWWVSQPAVTVTDVEPLPDQGHPLPPPVRELARVDPIVRHWVRRYRCGAYSREAALIAMITDLVQRCAELRAQP